MDNETFIAKIDKYGVIWSKGIGTQKDIEVGFDNKAVADIRKESDELFEKANKYLTELYETYEKSNGQYGRQKPKTVEQISSEQMKVNQEMYSMLQEIKTELKSLKESKENKIKII